MKSEFNCRSNTQEFLSKLFCSTKTVNFGYLKKPTVCATDVKLVLVNSNYKDYYQNYYQFFQMGLSIFEC